MTWNDNASMYDEHLGNYRHELDKNKGYFEEIKDIINKYTDIPSNSLNELKEKLSDLILVDHEFVVEMVKPPESVEYVKFFIYAGDLYLLAYKDNYNIDYSHIYRYDFTTNTWAKRRTDFNVTRNAIQHGGELYINDSDNGWRISSYNLETEETTVIQKLDKKLSWESGLSYNGKLYYFERNVSNQNGLFNISTYDVNTKTFNFNISSNKGPYKFDTYAGYEYVYTESKYKLFILVSENMLLIYDVVTGTFQNINVGNFVKTKQITSYSRVDGSAMSMCSVAEDWLFFPIYKKAAVFYNYTTNEIRKGLDKKIPENFSQASFLYKNTIIIGGESGDFNRLNNSLIIYYPKLNFL